MKATHTTSAPSARMHQALAAAGIVIAIMCALVLMKDAKTAIGPSSALPRLHVPPIAAATVASVTPLSTFMASVVRLF